MSDRQSSTRAAPGRHAARPRPRVGWPEVALALGLVLLGLLAISATRMYLVRYELSQRLGATQTEIDALADQQAELRAELESARSDDGVERLAREALGWARRGETAVVVEGARVRPPKPTPAPTPAEPAWRGIWRLLGR
jgi:cell division protein FtsB